MFLTCNKQLFLSFSLEIVKVQSCGWWNCVILLVVTSVTEEQVATLVRYVSRVRMYLHFVGRLQGRWSMRSMRSCLASYIYNLMASSAYLLLHQRWKPYASLKHGFHPQDYTLSQPKKITMWTVTTLKNWEHI